MEILSLLGSGFAIALTPANLFYCFVGSLVGTAVGVLPGLGPPATIALLLPVTYGIPATSAVILLAGIFYGAMYGGSTTSILLNIPGEAASVVTCLDGYQMARQGRAGAALAVAAVGSFIAGTIGVVGLMLLAPPLASFALKFGAPENAALLILGLLMVGYLGGASMTKGLMMAVVGLLLGSVGLDPIQGTPRFTYGIFKLSEGFDFVLVAMGLFGIGEVLANVEQTEEPEVITTKIGGLLATREEWKAAAAPMARGSLLGFIIGVLPGGGAIISSFLSYAIEKRISRHPERFGKGAPEGVIAPEASNNSCIPTSLIPALTLGIPGGATSAILLVAVTLQGLRPGPMLFTSNPELIWGFFMGLLVGAVIATVLYLVMIPWFALITIVRIELLAPMLLIITLFGAYANERNMMDVFVAIFFGLFGYFLRRHGYPLISLVIGLILGRLAEGSFHQALMISDHDYSVFILRPLSALIFAVCLVLVLWPGVKTRLGRGGAEVT